MSDPCIRSFLGSGCGDGMMQRVPPGLTAASVPRADPGIAGAEVLSQCGVCWGGQSRGCHGSHVPGAVPRRGLPGVRPPRLGIRVSGPAEGGGEGAGEAQQEREVEVAPSLQGEQEAPGRPQQGGPGCPREAAAAEVVPGGGSGGGAALPRLRLPRRPREATPEVPPGAAGAARAGQAGSVPDPKPWSEAGGPGEQRDPGGRRELLPGDPAGRGCSVPEELLVTKPSQDVAPPHGDTSWGIPILPGHPIPADALGGTGRAIRVLPRKPDWEVANPTPPPGIYSQFPGFYSLFRGFYSLLHPRTEVIVTWQVN
ncbi:collagen alpha-1(I) chain-like [Neopelma chrysocephalum]|uniref:collagen alpha-1(I) chain-like n=1 Tax=Neopelma chrysocephalum TaxID=114329 RepID=UPI000FCCF7C0|nr:collagen alpha-1(I) chain-like [Neopelma chrysocephalum]